MKKLFAVLLSLIMALSVFGIRSFAAAETATDAGKVVSVTDIDLTFDFDIGGKAVADYEDYITINTEGVEFEDNYDDLGVYAGQIYSYENAENYLEGEFYGISVYLTPIDGYVIPMGEEVTATVNGEEVECDTFVYHYYDEEADKEIPVPTYQIFVTAVIGPNGGVVEGKTKNIVREISIDVHPEAGMRVGDWEEYITINTPHVILDIENGYPGAYVYDAETYTYLSEDHIFEAGREYEIEVQLTTEDGYCLPFAGLEKVTVNGEETYNYYTGTYSDDGIVFVDYAAVTDYEIPDGENAFFDLVLNYFLDIKTQIETFLRMIINLITF